jgi:hypothetical protein
METDSEVSDAAPRVRDQGRSLLLPTLGGGVMNTSLPNLGLLETVTGEPSMTTPPARLNLNLRLGRVL